MKEKQIKTIYLLRHAKAENQDLRKNDFERRLVEKGQKHAEKMAKLMASFRFPPEFIYSSAAPRARETAEIFAQALKLEDKLTLVENFYAASHPVYLQAVQKLPDELSSVLMVGHNPILEDLVMNLTGKSNFHLKMPTCAFASIHFHVTLWSEIRPATGILRTLLYPKLFSD